MSDLLIPDELRHEWESYVKRKFKGDEEAALVKVIGEFLERENATASAGEQFSSALKKVHHRRDHKDEILEQGLSDAFKRMDDRKKKFDKFFE